MVVIDALGLVCPMPLIRLQQQLESLAIGTTVELICDDSGIEDDAPIWCQQTGNRLLSIDCNEQQQFIVRVVKVATE